MSQTSKKMKNTKKGKGPYVPMGLARLVFVLSLFLLFSLNVANTFREQQHV